MKITKVKIKNFRGIKDGEVFLSDHNVLVGDNNIGKSSVLEAIDLVLGPERLSRVNAIDEHDFYAGEYLNAAGEQKKIEIEVIVADLNVEQQRSFKDHLEWWNSKNKVLLENPPAEGTDQDDVTPALRVCFIGFYDKEEDDFQGNTYFLNPKPENDELQVFRTSDKRLCGFLYLRTLRTGSRALSLERGSLLDIILKLQDKRLQIWEDVLAELRKLPVAERPELGITDILSTVQGAVRLFIPSDGADNPHLKVSDLTRESLRKTLIPFMDTGAKKEDGEAYAAPYQHQGTGTINILVLALLSLIAELKQNVIFAMEEPEIAIPPHTQKTIIDNIRKKSAQAIFTSHSPYVLEEFDPSEIMVLRKADGILLGIPAEFTSIINPKKYRAELRARFCEALLARRVLITEGQTEYDAFSSATRRLHELHPNEFKTLESLGIAIINAETDSQIAPLAELFNKLGKVTFAVYDKQTIHTQKADIEAKVVHHFESPETNCEKLILSQTPDDTLRSFGVSLVLSGEWPLHLSANTPTTATPVVDLKSALLDYLSWAKAKGGIADLIDCCSKAEMPKFIVNTLTSIQEIVDPKKIEIVEPLAIQIPETVLNE
jgi:putative ATP-dependent endonuclease of the OLD family